MDLFVAGFRLDLDTAGLSKIFKTYGFVVKSVKIIKDKSTGLSRGFGFVTIEDRKEAEKAITKMHGEVYEGLKLTVKEAIPLQSIHKDNTTLPENGKKKLDVKGSFRNGGPQRLKTQIRVVPLKKHA